MKKLISIFFLIAIAFTSQAQSHNTTAGSNCKYAKNRCTNMEGCPQCEVCNVNDKKEKEAKIAEDQRRVDERELFGALAVDRKNGYYYGWAYDNPSLADAEKRAVDECKKKGGDCSVVLTFLGQGCAAYRTIDGNVGTAFGWGLAKTKAEADEIAKKECLKRSKGQFPNNYVWTCNSDTKLPLKEIYNAKDEISDIVDNAPIGYIYGSAFSADGKKFASGSSDGTIRVWSVPSFVLISKFATVPADLYGSRKVVKELVFSADGKYIIAANGDGDGQVKIWGTFSGKLVKELSKEWRGYPSLSISPDGKYLVYGGNCQWQGDVCPAPAYIWSTDNWELIRSVTGHTKILRASSFSPDSRTLATCGVDGTVVFWDVATGSKKRTLNVTSDQVAEGHFSPDGKTFVTITWSEDSKIKLWDVASGSILKTLPGHGVFGEAISYYNNSFKVISTGSSGGSDSESMIIWDLSSGSKMNSFKLDYTNYNVNISPEGIIVTSGIGGIQIWGPNEQGTLKLLKHIK